MPQNLFRAGMWIGGAVLGAGLLLLGQAGAPGTGENRAVEGLRADAECVECHAEIGREWQGSAHAGIQRYRRLTEELGQEPTAHLAAYYHPAALQARDDPSRPPSARTLFPERGVDCISCHMDARFRMHGPIGLDAPHATVLDESMSSAQACIPCHGQGDELDQAASWRENGFEQAMLACQSCHMLDTYGRLVQHGRFADLPQRNRGAHTFRGPSDTAFLQSAILLELQQEDGNIRVSLTAAGMGHQFPGLGFRQAVLRTRGLDPHGKALWQREEIIEQSRKNRLQPNRTQVFTYPLKGASEAESVLLYKWTSQTPESEALVVKQVHLGGRS